MQNFWLDHENEKNLPVFDVDDIVASADKLFADIPYEKEELDDRNYGVEEELQTDDAGRRSAIVFIREPVTNDCGSICGEVEVVDVYVHQSRWEKGDNLRHVWIVETASSKRHIIKCHVGYIK
jgi:hypothetical protein